jgi:hypothetical protein
MLFNLCPINESAESRDGRSSSNHFRWEKHTLLVVFGDWHSASGVVKSVGSAFWTLGDSVFNMGGQLVGIVGKCPLY